MWSSRLHTKSSPKSSRQQPNITKKLCRSWLHLGIPAVPSSLPFQSLEPVSPSPIPLSQLWCQTHLPLGQFLPPCPHQSPPKPPSPHMTVPSLHPSLHCSPAFSFPPSCSSCHNRFGFAPMNVPAQYHRGMASSCSILHSHLPSYTEYFRVTHFDRPPTPMPEETFGFQ